MKGQKAKELLKSFIELAVVAVVTYLVFTYVVMPIRIQGTSMASTLAHEDMALVDAIGLKQNGVERFDVVIVDCKALNETIIKRVIGLPGETIEYKKDKLYVDGKYVKEDFLDQEFKEASKQMYNSMYFTQDYKITLGQNEYFVVGDNRLNSKDSRVLGPFGIEDFLGKNGFVIYPFDNFGWINNG